MTLADLHLRHVVADRLDVLAELMALDCELATLEWMFGATQPDIQDARRRQRALCLTLLEQLRDLTVACAAETVH